MPVATILAGLRRTHRWRGARTARYLSAWAMLLLSPAVLAAGTDGSFVGRPIYGEPATGLQLPPRCEVDPSWRSTVAGADLELWVVECNATPHVWLLKKQVIEVINARQQRVRYVVLEDRVYADEKAGESLSVQCTGPRDEAGYVVHGARWRADNKELRLQTARGVLRVDPRSQRLVDAEIGAVDCVRFPEREAMMKRLQQHN